MSRYWRAGSSTAWRKMRAHILDRDRYQCQMPTLVGLPCLAPASTVDHITPLAEGGAFLDPANLRAACARHNYAAGARLTNSRSGKQPRPPRPMTTDAWRLVHALDSLDCPDDAGRTVATRQLLRAGIKARSSALDAACAHRRDRALAAAPGMTTAPPPPPRRATPEWSW